MLDIIFINIFIDIGGFIMRKAVTVEETIYKSYCDECGVELKRTMQCEQAICEMCGCDLCDKCVANEISTCGDHREVYCKRCWDISKEYNIKIDNLEKQIDALKEEKYTKCKRH